jgi:thiamine transport system ATP-binding protein
MLSFESVKMGFDGFDLSVADMALNPNIYAVLGPSGAGKSTFLSVIAGFLRLKSGFIRWNTTDMTKSSPADRPVGMVFQDHNLFPHLTLYRNLALALTHRRRITDDQDRAIRSAMDRVGLGGLETRKPAAISGGQQSRAALARVLLQNRPITILDEPFAALGPALKNEMLDLVSELAHERGNTVLMVTHDPNDARRIAPKSILVADHMVHPPVETIDLLSSPPPSFAEYLGQVPNS